MFLRIKNGDFCFIAENVNEVLKTDIKITGVEYNSFFDMQAAGKQFRLKSDIPENGSLFDFVEEYVPEVTPEKDRYFSVCLKNDVLTKARHNIAYNAKSKVGGGYDTRYSYIDDSGKCRILTHGTYIILADLKCCELTGDLVGHISIERDGATTEVATNTFKPLNGIVSGQISVVAELSENDVVVVEAEQKNENYYRIGFDTSLTICPV